MAILLGIFLFLSVMLNLLHWVGGLFFTASAAPRAHESGPRLRQVYIEDHRADDHIAVLDVDGIIMSGMGSGSTFDLVTLIESQLKRAEEDASVKAVVLRVNSPGGEVLASDNIYRLISDFQTRSHKPVIASMGSLAASGGYYISAPCRWIVANELTLTGSIGVIMHGYNYRGLMDKVGIRPEVYKSGRFKNMMSGDRRDEEIVAEERSMIQGLVDESFNRFKKVIKDGRTNARREDKGSDQGVGLSTNWTDFADGRVLSGRQALDIGLVDELGTFKTAVDRAKSLVGIKEANLIQYIAPFDLGSLLGLLGKSETPAIKVDVGLDIPKLKAGQPYFLFAPGLR